MNRKEIGKNIKIKTELELKRRITKIEYLIKTCYKKGAMWRDERRRDERRS